MRLQRSGTMLKTGTVSTGEEKVNLDCWLQAGLVANYRSRCFGRCAQLCAAA